LIEGVAMRTTFLPFALPDVDNSELDQLKEALFSGWITTGPKTKQFEAEFAQAVGAKHALAVNSCTAAMHLALEAIGLQRGDEVITTPYTFAATAEVVRYFDAKPVLVDIQAEDFNINPAVLEAAITPRTKAIIPVHIAGLAADLDAIQAIADKHGLAVIEDAAHAFPTKYKGRWIGQDPEQGQQAKRITCFSFYATKTLTTAEGGMICTNDDDIADRCRIMALHGISRDAWKRYTAEGSWYYEIIAPGYKYNLTDIASALGLAQLAKAERMRQRRAEIAHAFHQVFGEMAELQVPVTLSAGNPYTTTGSSGTNGDQPSQHAWHLYMLRLNLDRLRIDRAQFITELKQHNIGASVHFIPLHLHPYYRESYGYQAEDFPVAYREFHREISLPIYSKMSDQDVQDVIDAVVEIVESNRI
jgi:dTDP-4-amino-4,6-dideoxygalactose transaminase